MTTNIKDIKCVLLDFDGTTADTSQSIIHCVNRVLEPMGAAAEPAKVRTYGSNPREVLSEAGAEYLVDDFAKVAKIILGE